MSMLLPSHHHHHHYHSLPRPQKHVIPNGNFDDHRILFLRQGGICFPGPAISVGKYLLPGGWNKKKNVQPDEIEALCHCLKCKRGNGSSFSTNLIIPAGAFELIRGEPAKYTSKGGSGKDGSSHFCRDCGSPLYVTSELATGVVIVKTGTLDKWELAEKEFKPTTEMFCATKYSWLPSIEGVIQSSGAN